MQNLNYTYPKGDFLSGFSETDDNPCDYEIACQTLVIRGMDYIDANPTMKEKLLSIKSAYDTPIKPLTDYMTEFDFGLTGAMVSHAVQHLIYPVKFGWDKYIEKLQSFNL